MTDRLETLASEWLETLESIVLKRKELLDIGTFAKLSQATQKLPDEEHAPVEKITEVSGTKFLKDYDMLAYLDQDSNMVLVNVILDKNGLSDPILVGRSQLNYLAIMVASDSRMDRENSQYIFYKVDCSRCDISSLLTITDALLKEWNPCPQTWTQWAKPIVQECDFLKVQEVEDEEDVKIVEPSTPLTPGQNYVQLKRVEDCVFVTGEINRGQGPIYHITGEALEDYNWPVCNLPPKKMIEC